MSVFALCINMLQAKFMFLILDCWVIGGVHLSADDSFPNLSCCYFCLTKNVLGHHHDENPGYRQTVWLTDPGYRQTIWLRFTASVLPLSFLPLSPSASCPYPKWCCQKVLLPLLDWEVPCCLLSVTFMGFQKYVYHVCTCGTVSSFTIYFFFS